MRLFICMTLLLGISSSSIAQIDEDGAPSTSIWSKIVPSIEVGILGVYTADSTFMEQKRADRIHHMYLNGFIGINAYYSLLTLNDNASLGLQSGLHLGYDLRSRPTNWLVHVPVIFMGKVGTNASRYSTSNFGLAAGIGLDMILQDINSFGERYNYTGLGLVPSAAIEVTAGKKNVILFDKRQVKRMYYTIRLGFHLKEGPIGGTSTIKRNSSWYTTTNGRYGFYSVSAMYNF